MIRISLIDVAKLREFQYTHGVKSLQKWRKILANECSPLSRGTKKSLLRKKCESLEKNRLFANRYFTRIFFVRFSWVTK